MRIAPFLIQLFFRDPLRIALSVLCIVGSTKTIKHFSVRYDPSLSGYSIALGKRFTQLKDLTDYYKGEQWHVSSKLFPI